MKNLKRILMVSAMASVAFGGAASALGKEITSPGGYNFTNRLAGGTAGVDFKGDSIKVSNNLFPSPHLVSYWHGWFWSDDMGRRTEPTWIPSNTGVGVAAKKNRDRVYYSAYSNTGYVAVVEIQTAHYFYYLEFDALSNTISLTYNTYGGYPYFSAPHWTAPVDIWSGQPSLMHIMQNKYGSLDINIFKAGEKQHPNIDTTWILPW